VNNIVIGDINYAMREAECLAKVSSRIASHVVEFHGYFTMEKSLALVMELCDGTLDDLLTQLRGRTNTWRWDVIYQIACGLERCHSKQIMHRDLKPDNYFPNPFMLF
jgi:serine/threonine protein kinase